MPVMDVRLNILMEEIGLYESIPLLKDCSIIRGTEHKS